MPVLPPSGFAEAAPHFHGHRERLRERVAEVGFEHLADYEMLEMLLFAVNRRSDTKAVAKALLARFGTLHAVLTAAEDELLVIRGVGAQTVNLLRIVHAAAVRLHRDEASRPPQQNMSSWKSVADYCRVAFGTDTREQFRVFFLNARNELIRDEVMSRGTVNHTPVYPREVMARALALSASAIILVHNHPSGDTTPSRADIDMTKQLVEVARAFDIQIHDHIIIGASASYSFRSHGLM